MATVLAPFIGMSATSASASGLPIVAEGKVDAALGVAVEARKHRRTSSKGSSRCGGRSGLGRGRAGGL